MYQTKLEGIKIHFMLNNFFLPKNHAVHEAAEKCGRAGQAAVVNLTRRMRFACWVLKATDTHLVYVILVAFPRLQSLRERTGVLGYPYIACIVVARSVRAA
jgi:hypothetical protein